MRYKKLFALLSPFIIMPALAQENKSDSGSCTKTYSLNKVIVGTLYFTHEDPDGTQLNFRPKFDSSLGIPRAPEDHRTMFSISESGNIYNKLNVSEEQIRASDFCWEWNAKYFVEKYIDRARCTEVPGAVASGHLLKAWNLKKQCDWAKYNSPN